MHHLLLAAIVLFASVGHAQGTPPAKVEDVQRFVRATQYVGHFRAGVESEKEKSGRSNLLIEFILKSDTAELEQSISSVFSRHLTHAQGKEAADFYTSATGRSITEAQLAQSTRIHTPLVLTPEQAKDYRKFAASGTEAAVARLLQDRSIGAELMVELERARPK